jgi:hypothetical protein
MSQMLKGPRDIISENKQEHMNCNLNLDVSLKFPIFFQHVENRAQLHACCYNIDQRISHLTSATFSICPHLQILQAQCTVMRVESQKSAARRESRCEATAF